MCGWESGEWVSMTTFGLSAQQCQGTLGLGIGDGQDVCCGLDQDLASREFRGFMCEVGVADHGFRGRGVLERYV